MFGCLCSPALPPRSRYAWACSTWNGRTVAAAYFRLPCAKSAGGRTPGRRRHPLHAHCDGHCLYLLRLRRHFCRDADACSAAAGHRDARSSHRRMWCHHDYRDLRGGARLQPNPHHHAHSPVVRWAVRRRRIRTLRTSYRFGRQCRGDRSADSLVDRRCRAACHHQRAHTQPGRRDLPLPAAALADARLGCTPPLGISDSASIPKSKPGTRIPHRPKPMLHMFAHGFHPKSGD